ncbi:MAG: sporulation protein YabP [Sarcina sp.]
MENKGNANLMNNKSSICLESRKKLLLTGILEVISFDEEQISLNTTQGKLNILGNNLKVNKLDVQNGDVVIQGLIKSMIYCGKKPRKKLKIFNKRKNK